MKTGFLKRSPDYDGAANEYSKAATCYKTMKQTDKCVMYNEKAAECYKNNRSYYSAAKCYEAIAFLYGKDLNNWSKAITAFETASFMYREHGVPDTAALCLDRGAKALESVNPEKAAEFYATASDVSMIENKCHQAAEFAAKAARVFMKLKNLDKAAEMVNTQLDHLVEASDLGGCSRVVVCLTIVHLARGDFVAAKKAFLDGRCYVDQQELYTMELLLDGVDSTDAKKVLSALNHPFLKSLDNEITKLIRDLEKKYKEMQEKDAAAAAGGQSSQADEDEAAALM